MCGRQAELDAEEESLKRLRRWHGAIRTNELAGALNALLAGRRHAERAERLNRFAEQVGAAREYGGRG
jgi:hypothetical protein